MRARTSENSQINQVTAQRITLKAQLEKAAEEKRHEEAVALARQELADIGLELQIINTKMMDTAVGIAEQTDLGVIFFNFLFEAGRKFIEEVGHFFLFPIAGVAAIIRADLAWKQAALENGKHGGWQRAIIETVSAVVISIAVIGGLISQAFAAVASPLIFTVLLAAKTVYALGSAIYYYGKSTYPAEMAKTFADKEARLRSEADSADESDKQRLLTQADAAKIAKVACQTEAAKYRAMAKANLIGGFALVLGTLAVGFVMIAAKPAVAILGIISAVVGVVFAVKNYKTLRIQKNKLTNKPTDSPSPDEGAPRVAQENGLTVNASLRQRLSGSAAPAPKNEGCFKGCASAFRTRFGRLWQRGAESTKTSEAILPIAVESPRSLLLPHDTEGDDYATPRSSRGSVSPV